MMWIKALVIFLMIIDVICFLGIKAEKVDNDDDKDLRKKALILLGIVATIALFSIGLAFLIWG